MEVLLLSPIEIVLLALLYEKDRYGYEIESIIEERKMRNWTKIGFSSIYNSLNNLEKKGLAGWRMETEYGSPERKVYFIKDDARESVPPLIAQLLHSPQRVYSEFSIGLAFSYLLPKGEVRKSLLQYRESLEKRRQGILSTYDEQPQAHEMPHVKALFTHPLKLIEAEMEWIDELVKEMEEDSHDH
jgi:DNA-binding PadR family transcriptional regulator